MITVPQTAEKLQKTVRSLLKLRLPGTFQKPDFTLPENALWPPGVIGASPSGKAADFDSAMRRFDSSRPSQPYHGLC
jgi:hypothetical protein